METGIKPDTLRAWERRYGIPAPQRTDSGHRLYTQRDIEILKWLLQRQDEGLSISRAVALWHKLENDQGDPLQETDPHAGNQAARQGGPGNGSNFGANEHLQTSRDEWRQNEWPQEPEGGGARLHRLRERWMAAVLAFDEQAADETLATAFGLFSPEAVCVELIQKSLAAIGQGWYEGRVTVQQEHFASALAIRRVDSMLASTPAPSRAGRILVGCPPEEVHTFAPLMLSLFLRRRGWNVIYLGADVPVQSLEPTIDTARPDLLLLTAQQLHTVVGLLEMAHVLAERHIPMGYGGLIFNRLPGLQRLIPGYFLGTEFLQGVQAVERIMASPRPRSAETEVDAAHIRALAHFQERRSHIEAELWKQLETGNLPQRQLTAGNNNFGRSIQAALALGDMNYLGSDMDWIRGLLKNHNRMPHYMIDEYIGAYRSAAHLHLDAPGAPLLAWLDKIHVAAGKA